MKGSLLTLLATQLAVAMVAACNARAEHFDVRAQVTPLQHTVLSSEIAGKILTLPSREGEAFEKGQEIAAIDCAAYRARLAQANAQVSRVTRKAEALRMLDKRGATGKVELDIAEIDIQAADAERELAAIDVSRCSLVAPFSGRVSELKVRPHQYVSAGEPVIALLSDRALEIELLAPSRSLAWLAPGATFLVKIDELGREYPAIVTRIGASIDPVSQSVKIYSKIDGDPSGLIPGMSGTAHLTSDRAEAILQQ